MVEQDEGKEAKLVGKETKAGNLVNYIATLLLTSIQIALFKERTDSGLAFFRDTVWWWWTRLESGIRS